MSTLPIVITPSGGFAVTETVGGLPVAPVVSGGFGIAVTLVSSGGFPVSGTSVSDVTYFIPAMC